MKNKICVIVPSNLHFAPYYYRYEDILKKYDMDYDLIIWDREGITEKANTNIIPFKVYDKTNNGNFKKIYKFFLFSRFVKMTINKNKYTKLIFLGSYAGNGLLINQYLKKYYHGKYWFDIRDYTYEWFWPFYYMEKITIKNSNRTVISSDGFLKFLPKHQYVKAHNIDKRNINLAKGEKPIQSSKIRISFIGNVRYIEENKKLIELFKNDNRFILQFYGKGSEQLETYCKKYNITNTRFEGYFDTSKTKTYYAQTDIINNVYGNDNIGVRTALSNKLYFSLGLHKPILVSPNTYMANLTCQYGIGFIIDYSNCNLPDELFHWFNDKTYSNKEPDYNGLWNKVLEKDLLFEKELKYYITSE